MFSTVKIENGVILDGKKLKCVKSYKLEQKERDDIAELTVNMDVRVFCKDDKPSDIKVGTIKADKPSSLRLSDLANLIADDVLVKVVYQKEMGTAVNIYEPGSISGEDPKFLEKPVKTIRTIIDTLVIELEDRHGDCNSKHYLLDHNINRHKSCGDTGVYEHYPKSC